MALSRRERFNLKSRMIEIQQDDRSWTFERTNLLLSEFGFTVLDRFDSNGEFTFGDSIQTITDADLVEMYSLITGADDDDVRAELETADSSLWKPGYVRVFLSHSAMHKQFIGQVASELAVSGIHAFVAHDTMEYEEPWQDQIEHGLRTMQAFVAITHPEFLTSAWCQQEVGWALGRGVPRYVIRYPADPAGFIGRTQWPQAAEERHVDVAARILEWISRMPEFSDQIVAGLLSALRAADNYLDAGATAKRIATVDTLNVDQWSELAEIYHSNDQVGGAGLVRRELQPYYRSHGQAWPPQRLNSVEP